MKVSEYNSNTPSPTRTHARSAELSALTGLRFFAAAYVVCYHFIRVARPPFAIAGILSAGYTAVGLFFLLSGFILTYSYAQHNGTLPVSRRAFWAARFGRIYPAYFFAFLVAAPFQILGSFRVNPPLLAAKKLAVGGAAVLSLLQAWSPWTVWYWNSPAWSVSVEAFFYLCFPFLVPWIARIRPAHLLPWLAVAWAASLVPAILFSLHGWANHPPLPLAQVAIEMNPLLRLPEFVCGILLGRYYAAGYRIPAAYSGKLAALAIAGIVVVLSNALLLPRPVLAGGLMLPLSALLLLSLADGHGWPARLLSMPAVKALGEASYGIYILQIPVSYLFALTPEGFSPSRFIVFFAGLIAISFFSLRFLEQPLRLRIKRLFAEPVSANPALPRKCAEQDAVAPALPNPLTRYTEQANA